MKIERFNERINSYPRPDMPATEEDMIFFISDIIQSWVGIREVPYTDGDMEIDPKSIDTAAWQVYLELKTKGVDFDLFFSAKKYNV